MKILFLGYSKLFKNRLIPVLNQLTEITEIHIAKFKNQEWDNEYKKLNLTPILYDSYQDALKKAKIDICYISSVNSSHYDLAKASLLRGWHTIVDKPITINKEELEDLIERSDRLGQQPCLLAESLVYIYHPQFQKIKEILTENNAKIKTINVLFSIPPLDKNNFRYNKELGGGVINDMGPYAVSIGRYFFNEKPNDVICKIGECVNDVDISFDVILKYSNNKSVIGHFGFNTEYINSMIILGDNIKILIDPVFTIPDHINALIKYQIKNSDHIEITDKCNNFYLFFKDIFNAINNKDLNKFKNIMMTDCKTLELLRHKNINI
jgi:hypothetical protein